MIIIKKDITIYTANCKEKEYNTQYPNRREISSAEDMAKALVWDNVPCRFKDNHRMKSNFISADCVVADLDNSHTDEESDWYDIGDVCDRFPDVCFYYVESRNHMKDKRLPDGTVKQARPKYHFYFPLLEPVTTSDDYEFISYTIGCLFPVFDNKVADCSHFLFSVSSPIVQFSEGSVCIDEYLRDYEE